MIVYHQHPDGLIMLRSSTVFSFACALAFLLTPILAHAQNSQQFGDIVVHYNALASDLLSADVARQYGITRSNRGGLLNIAVQRTAANGAGVAVKSTISGEAVNLTGQKKPIVFREIAGADVSYIGLFDVSGPDTWTFALTIKPDDSAKPLSLRFNQNFIGE